MKKPETSISLRSLAYFSIFLFLLVVAEGLSYFALTLNIEGIENRIYRPPTVSREKFEKYLDRREPLLGWPAKNAASDGARYSPANEMLGDRPICVTLYGDSYTYSTEVDDIHAWGNLLARNLSCRVKNYGVSGYGVDQAILRFENNTNYRDNLVILGIYAGDVNRNVNQWRYLLGGGPLAFKPSFFVDADGGLQLEGIPINSHEDYIRLINAPEDLLKNEFYLPDGKSIQARVLVSFPFSWSFLKLMRKIILEINWTIISPSIRVREWNYPRWYDTSNGPSLQKIQLNTLLVERFLNKCRNDRRRCVVLFIPGIDEINFYMRYGRKIFDVFADPIRRFSSIWDATEFYADKARGRGVCYYIGPDRNCLGHYNIEGNLLLAQFVAENIKKHNLASFPHVVE